MKILRGYVCWNCKVKTEAMLEFGEYPECPRCKKAMEFHYSNCNFDSFFAGSHNAEYTTSGRKFNGCTKKQLLENVSYKKRVEDGRDKAGHNRDEVDWEKHDKKID